MKELLDGAAQFREKVVPEKRALFEQLATGQAPKTLFITCSDSRVVPNLITQQDPGNLFVIRNAGNLIPENALQSSGEASAVEYAVAALGVEHIVVCGHSGCGAMGALLAPESTDALPVVRQWLENAADTLSALEAKEAASEDERPRLERAVEVNAVTQLEHLKQHPSVKKALGENKLTLHAWTYDIGSGRIAVFDDASDRFTS